MPALEIPKMLVLSTAHLEEETCNTLLPAAPGSAYPKADYGWFVPLVDSNAKISPALTACLNFAQAMGCEWVMFDRDGPTIPELSVFDW